MQDTNLLEDQPIAWRPTPDVIERAQLTKFMKQVGVTTWDELYEFSIRDVERFTEEVLKFLDIRFDPPYGKLMDVSDGVEFPTWFSSPQRRGDAEKAETRPVGSVSHAGLNITTMCLDRWQTDEMKDQPAAIWEGEEGSVETLTYSALYDLVAKCAAGLRQNGLGKGDAIGIHLPMLPETVIALLAINRIGALAVPVFSGYGVEAIVSRMNAVGARAIFTSLGFQRRGKQVRSAGFEAAGKSPTVETVFIVRSKPKPAKQSKPHEPLDAVRKTAGGDAEAQMSFGIDEVMRSEIEHPSRLVWWAELVGSKDVFAPEPTSAEDPLIILYTSGTTGKPKGIAHTHASFPIKAAQDMAFGTDVGKGTRISWYTDIGWMMGPWLIYGALINGATICIYDGAPDYPTPDRMWEFCAKHKVEVLGISPTLIRSLAASEESSPPYEGGVAAASADGVVLPRDAENHPPAEAVPLLRKDGSSKAPFERHDLSSLRIFASTGEPWNPAPWWWLFEKVGNSKLPIINYSGGTEIAGGILMGNPLLPIKPCSFPAPCPGMDVDILDEDGNSVPDGKVGELVIKQPWIGMARGFWQEKERYLDTYWRRFRDIWVHGDWAMRDKDGHWFILGRSDDTLKVAGKRVGPAEVESLLVAHPLVTEAAVIGVPDEVKGTAMVAFCVLSSPPYEGGVDAASADGVVLSLEKELKALVAKDMGKPLAPSKIHFVSALPKTRNAKVMRRVIRSAYLGEDPGDLSALENPQAVEEIAAAGKDSE
ncbi:MAG: AMP-binding protein [Acidobacteria bacterium]|nr:AMP-binding protein [Acidobacteriota bacterium]